MTEIEILQARRKKFANLGKKKDKRASGKKTTLGLVILLLSSAWFLWDFLKNR